MQNFQQLATWLHVFSFISGSLLDFDLVLQQLLELHITQSSNWFSTREYNVFPNSSSRSLFFFCLYLFVTCLICISADVIV